jgi:RNA polymerase sigma factor (sigma-70 family)
MNTINYKDLKAEQKTAQWLKANGVSEQLFEKADIWLLQAHIAASNILKHNIEQLTDKEREIIRLFFGIGMNHGLTLEEIGAKFNLTRERVRQIKEKAIRRLRHTSRNKLLKAYLG